ncbi:GNAT family N-acetyltransferase [Jeotgalibacillus haloalkalitolerans]|uniref:GNAT family protein n=1 Tax=Jeotgalibacillus haloalkalitolerans TaxID=3104292 RepID=A0ABU5KPM1_9BACL|nr:GNAT family protein [Jeotgalibacillus sp. HH7-29]MDZ5712681.1 GNAT family protein [Jeotgalibacillus sp. HH7-29]
MLREIIESDWSAIHEYASQEIVCQYQVWGPNSVEDTKAYVDQVMKDTRIKPRTRYVFAIINNDDKHLAGVGELIIRDPQNRNAEIAYIINPAYWGKGLATEAAGLLIHYGFEEHRMHRIFATCAPENIASSKVLKKSGMVYEGRLRENLLIGEKWRDSMIYSVLKNEWKADAY